MSEEGQVHWEEGLFLQPHHLQWMQKRMLDKFARERRFSWTHPYGLVDMHISDDELSDFRVRFDRLRAVMPSGLEIRVPEDTDLPSLSIKEAFLASGGTLTVSLGVPLWYSSRRNMVADQGDEQWRSRQLYRVAEVQYADENTGENPQAIRVRRVNARLLLDQDDRSDLEVLPLLKLRQVVVEEDVGVPRRDPGYVPPCLLVSGSPVLTELLRDMAGQVMASRNELIPEVTRGGYSVDNLRGRQVEQLMRLRTLSRFGAMLDSYRQVPRALAPFDLYVLLRQLHSELAALQPDRDLFGTAEYDHERVWDVFSQLAEQIRSLLKGTAPPKFLKVPLERRDDLRCLGAALTEEHFSLPNEYFLAVKTKTDPKQLAPLVGDRDQFKLMPPSLVDKPIYGVKLEYEAYPPVELPAGVGLHYFRLNRAESARMWSRIEQEKAVAVRWPGMESSDYVLALYMTVP